jgi:hypothetical protein
MILGMSIHAFTVLHVVISLICIVSGLIVLYGMFGSQRMSGWTALFLATTILTSMTGFLFPREGFTPRPGGRLSVPGGAGSDAPRALCLSPSWSLALDLCGWRGTGPLSECLRRSRAGFPEATVPAAADADAAGATLPRRDERRLGDLVVAGIVAVKTFHPDAGSGII